MNDIFKAVTPSNLAWWSTGGNALFYGAIIFFSVAISFLIRKINRRMLLFTSVLLGIFSTILLAFLEGVFFATILSILLGASIGLFLPSSMALVGDYTIVENRGRASGIIILSTFVLAFVSMEICQLATPDIIGVIVALVAVRSISLFALVMEKFYYPSTMGEKRLHLPKTAFREFVLYVIPWAMFTFASSLANTLIPSTFESELQFGLSFRYVFIAIFGLAAGFIADRFGRKQPIIFGLATLGIGYLLLGFNMSGQSVIAYYILSGVTWGLFFVVFLAVPGDLSIPNSREKFYALGYILPVTGVFALATLPVTHLTDIISETIIAQIMGFSIFLAMYPVFRAKETLPEKEMRDRRMREYVEKLGKTIQETDYDD